MLHSNKNWGSWVVVALATLLAVGGTSLGQGMRPPTYITPFPAIYNGRIYSGYYNNNLYR